MAEHYKIDCDKVEDRKALVVVLTMNGYTVRMGQGEAQRQIRRDLLRGVLEGRR